MSKKLRKTSIFPLLIAAMAMFSGGCSKSPSETAVSASNADAPLRVALLADLLPPLGAEEASLELTLAQAFADRLGRRLDIKTARSHRELALMLHNNQADLALGIPQQSAVAQTLALTRAYSRAQHLLVYKQNRDAPDALASASEGLRVPQESRASEVLVASKAEHPDLYWREMPLPEGALLGAVVDETVQYAVVSSPVLRVKRRIWPDLSPAFAIGDADLLTWAVSPRQTLQLFDAADHFLGEQLRNGRIAALERELHSPLEAFDYLDSRNFVAAALDRLPQYRALFTEAAGSDLDWRLLAAVAYQESHWREDAISKTGVQGLMMLTRDTAERVGIDDRTDPAQSIKGGAEYFREVIGKLPERIAEPDRTWFALAAYNVGFGHLEDARILAQRDGLDPDRWDDVKKKLPLLRDPAVAAATRNGWCRGDEPVHFVNRIQRYHATLRWLSGEHTPEEERRMAGLSVAAN